MILILDKILEIVVYCIGVAECVTLSVNEVSHWVSTLAIHTIGTSVVSRSTIILLVCIVIPIQT